MTVTKRPVSRSPRFALGLLVTVLVGGCIEQRGPATITTPHGGEHRALLLSIHGAMGGDGWLHADNWGTDAPLDSWYGVTTDAAGNVTKLDLRENRVTGGIPAEIGLLGTLEVLNLQRNDLTGPIPPELGNLRSLKALQLERNDLTGSIPPELGNLRDLAVLLLDRNDLTGRVPPELGGLPNLEVVDLQGNRLTGPPPPEFHQLKVPFFGLGPLRSMKARKDREDPDSFRVRIPLPGH